MIQMTSFGGLVLALTYGLPIRDHDDPYLALVEEAIRTLATAAVPGAFSLMWCWISDNCEKVP